MRTTSQAKTLALFASGTGSNVRRICAYFQDDPNVRIGLVVSNRPDAPVVAFARDQGLPVRLIDRSDLKTPGHLIDDLRHAGTDVIVLAGFLWKIPDELLKAFPDRILNIHPALLPKYGGQGMYGRHVHEAVLANGDPESGITIHLVNERYDEGQVLFQASCPVWNEDTPDTLAERIHGLEHEHFPLIIQHFLKDIS